MCINKKCVGRFFRSYVDNANHRQYMYLPKCMTFDWGSMLWEFKKNVNLLPNLTPNNTIYTHKNNHNIGIHKNRQYFRQKLFKNAEQTSITLTSAKFLSNVVTFIAVRTLVSPSRMISLNTVNNNQCELSLLVFNERNCNCGRTCICRLSFYEWQTFY
jgi:hypothetical protein